MEKILFKKISVWIVLLLAILGIIIAILFGASVRHYYVMGNRMLGNFGIVMVDIASVPSNIKKLITKYGLVVPNQRFEGEKGFTFNYAAGTRPDLGYLLLNRYDNDLKMSVSELVDLNTQEQIHQWRFDVNPLWDISNVESNLFDLKRDRNTKRYRNIHSYLLETGNLLTSHNVPVLKSDLCSHLTIFKDDDLYHHAIEMDADGNFWISKFIEPKNVKLESNGKFMDDAITLLNPDGTILFEKSIGQIFKDNGMEAMAYGGPETDDPTHLNDIQPVLKDSPYWKKGDVFISLRNQSMLMLYRPSTNKLLWYQQGPWLHQHDVDIVDNHTIALFNNNQTILGMKGTNQIIMYDFQSKRITKPFETAFGTLEIHTPVEGLFDLVNDNEIFVEETLSGRLLQFDKNGSIFWQYINRASDGKVYYVNWSRLISRGLGDKVRQKIKEVKCDEH
ncbi:arylsulfotransferase family protein [Thermodesulfobacteriota bacterium]